MPSHRVRVVLADDHPIFREGLRRSLAHRADLAVVGVAGDGREALDLIRELVPDVALVDLRLPTLSGADIARAVQRDGLATKVLVISAHDNPAVVYDTLGAGAVGFLAKDVSREDVADAIAAAARGEALLPPSIQTELVGHLHQRAAAERPLLTPREREVLGYVAEGLSAPEIGRRLHLGTATVKTHLQSLYDKLGVSDRAAAVAVALRTGLLE